MKRLTALILAVLLVPGVAATNHLPVVEGIRITVSSQEFLVEWEPVASGSVAGYTVDVYAEAARVATYNATSPPVTHFGQNNRAYAFVVRARDAGGALGPPSDPATAVATEPNDLVYLAVGLSVLWIGLWGHALMLARAEVRARARLDKIHEAKQRFGEKK